MNTLCLSIKSKTLKEITKDKSKSPCLFMYTPQTFKNTGKYASSIGGKYNYDNNQFRNRSYGFKGLY